MGAGSRRLGRGELIAGASALLLAADEFLPWYSRGGQERTAWQAFSVLDVLMALVAVGGAGLVAVALVRRSVALSMAGSVMVCVLAVIAALVLLGRLALGPPGPGDASTRLWAFVGLVLVAGVGYGAFEAMRDERVDWPAAAGEGAAVPRRPAPTIGR